MSARIPHTYRRNGIYYVRFKWPHKVLNRFPNIGREFNRSLGTNQQHLARYKASAYISSLRSHIEYLDRIEASGKICSIKEKDLISSVVGYSEMSEEFEFIPQRPNNKIEVEVDPATKRTKVSSDLKDPDENHEEVLAFLQKMGVIPSDEPTVVESGPTVEDVSDLFITREHVNKSPA